jgi:hypothetical protein
MFAASISREVTEAALMMKAASSSEMLINFYKTRQDLRFSWQ